MIVYIPDGANPQNILLLMKVERGAYGVIIDCFKEHEKQNALATVSIDFFDNALTILYWDEQMTGADEPKRIPLATMVNKTLTRKEAPHENG